MLLYESHQTKTIGINVVLLLVIFTILSVSCDKELQTNDDPPIVKTQDDYELFSFDSDNTEYYEGKDTIRLGAFPLEGLEDDTIKFDPHKSISDIELQLTHALYMGLTTLDPKTGAPKLVLIDSWEVRKLRNGYTYILTLIEGSWTDGRSIEAEHVKNSLIRLLDPRIKNPHAAQLALAIRGGVEYYSLPKKVSATFLKQLESRIQINAVDSQTLYITISSKNVDLLKLLAHPTAAILPILSPQISDTTMFEVNSNAWEGNGPFIPETVNKNFIKLIANANFLSKPWVSSITFLFSDSLEQLIQMYISNSVDWVIIPYSDVRQFPKKASEFYSQELQEKDIHNKYFAGKVILDIPELSVLRQIFLSPNTLKSSITNKQKINYETELDINAKKNMNMIITQLLNELIQEFNAYNVSIHANTFQSNSVFMPYLPIVNTILKDRTPPTQQSTKPQIDASDTPLEILEGEVVESDENVKTNILDDSEKQVEVPLNQDSLNDLTKYELYLQDLRNILTQNQIGIPRIRIAYTHDFLNPYIDVMIEFFRTNKIPIESTPILLSHASPDVDSYDLAIRVLSEESDTTIGALSRLWWLWAGGKESPLRVLGDFHNIINQLLYSETTAQYHNLLVTLEEDIYRTSRFIPLWDISQQEIINSEQYSWWTPRGSWHPLFP